MNRTDPQVRSAAFEITTGNSVGFCDDTSQPVRFDGGCGAVAQAPAPLAAALVAALVDAGLCVEPPHAETARANVRMSAGVNREEKDRGDMGQA